MGKLKANGLVRNNMFGSEVIWGGTKYHFSQKKDRESFKGVFIFAMVKRDALNYCKQLKRPLRPAKNLPSIFKNDKIVVGRRKEWPADIDDAYWTIAYKLKIISTRTYNKGLMLEKRICNAALASLGSDKKYTIIRNGKITADKIVVEGDPQLKLVYAKIRNRCFRYMQELAKILGNDFIKYVTDCMYYIKSKENIAKVADFMAKNKLEYKGGLDPKAGKRKA